ncbi:hypothetical protein PAXRUDRAFT_17510 [Paxillus rubicundulus Ve08.2h10]|uniref:Uncharacterized protein n=1 Tax=Paxillus rubicundulus Ve08.2h10 TaxID=930991 RepID=A0A0D0D1J1_9AGAM|nr:hypothetical protein PAXRUDRAFT_17510 [Paxillus rubicundulus Ve08.2h10]
MICPHLRSQLYLPQSAPSAPKKAAKQVAFETAAACLHMLALTITGDADNLAKERDMWSNEWNVAMDVMAGANAAALTNGLVLQLPAAIIPSIWEADDNFRQIVLDSVAQKEVADCLEAEARAQAGSPMAEDLAPIEPAHVTPAPSVSLQATTWSQMEVVVPKGKGKKHSHQDLRADEAAPFPPAGMVIHPDPCTKCMGGTVPYHRLPGHTC